MITRGLLLAGEPIALREWSVRPKTLREIVKKEEEYNRAIGMLLIGPQTLGVEDGSLSDLSQFTLISLMSALNEEMATQIALTLEFFLEQSVRFEVDSFFVGNSIFEESDWENLKKIVFAQAKTSEDELKKQNVKKEFNPANEEAREAMERFKSIHEEISTLKKDKRMSDENPIFNLINAFCAKSFNTNITQVWDLTYYQFRDQFEQLLKTDQYDKDFQQVLAGADPKKLKLVHWTQ